MYHGADVSFRFSVKVKRYFPKNGYIDCLNFYFKGQKTPMLINPSFIGTASPFAISEETIKTLDFINTSFPIIKNTRVEWEGT